MNLRHYPYRTIAVALMGCAVVAMPSSDIPAGGAAYARSSQKASSNKKTATKKASARNASKSTKSASTSKKSAAKTNSKGRSSAQKKSSATGKQSAPKSSAEARRMQEAAQQEINRTREQIRLNEQEIKTGLADLNLLSSEISAGRSKVADLQKKVGTLGGEIDRLSGEIDKNEADLAMMRAEYLKALKKMRLTKKNQSVLAFVFASDNFNQAMRRIRYMRQFSAWRDKKTADIDNTITRLASEKDQLARTREMQTAALGQLSATQKELEAKHQKQERLVAGLRQNGSALQSHLAAKQNEANRLKESIASLIAQEQAKAEAERKAREKAEADRIAREKAEAERVAREKAEAQRRAAEAAAKEKAAEEAAAKEAAAKEAAREKAKETAKEAAKEPVASEKVKKNQDKVPEREPEKKKETDVKKDSGKKKNKEEKKKKNSEKGARSKKDRKQHSSPAVSPAASPSPAPAPKVQTVEKPDVKVNFASLRGSLPRPVDGTWRITNPFGRHSMPELPEVVYDNPGIDAEVQTGAAVKAVCSGKVSGVYKVSGYGNVVIVNHGEYYTVYGNLSSASVSVGSQVKTGQTLGAAAPDPDDSRRGSVHFEVWKGREKQNPSQWLR
ncbi:MAG: peptidoglycan DD-metalloendopeptidase family protein [Bacteroides sp.]|nr:peptidoglycan DD-metalloendopeptidase family protein [Bacteroides sp.]